MLQKVIKGLLAESVLIIINANVNIRRHRVRLSDQISHVLLFHSAVRLIQAEGLLEYQDLQNKSCMYLIAQMTSYINWRLNADRLKWLFTQRRKKEIK